MTKKKLDYKMRSRKGDAIITTNTGRYKVRVYRANWAYDDHTVCADGGEPTNRPMFGGNDQVVFSYCGEMYERTRFPYRPGPHLGRIVPWKSLSSDLQSSIIKRLKNDEDEPHTVVVFGDKENHAPTP